MKNLKFVSALTFFVGLFFLSTTTQAQNRRGNHSNENNRDGYHQNQGGDRGGDYDNSNQNRYGNHDYRNHGHACRGNHRSCQSNTNYSQGYSRGCNHRPSGRHYGHRRNRRMAPICFSITRRPRVHVRF